MKVPYLLALGLFLHGCALGATLPPSVAQSAQERELDDRVPKHLPITIKIKTEKERAFKELKNEHWAGDFELEVKNTGSKTIYFLVLGLVLPEITMPDRNPYGFSLHYGRSELVEITASVTPEDISIKPGETYVFKIPAHQIAGLEDYIRREQIQPPKKVQILFQLLNFGDGTGFVTTEGKAVDKNIMRNQELGVGCCLSKESIAAPFGQARTD